MPIAFMFTWVVATVTIALILRVTLAPALVFLLDIFDLGTPNSERIVGFMLLVSVVLGFAGTLRNHLEISSVFLGRIV
jgi:hypothetical protein